MDLRSGKRIHKLRDKKQKAQTKMDLEQVIVHAEDDESMEREFETGSGDQAAAEFHTDTAAREVEAGGRQVLSMDMAVMILQQLKQNTEQMKQNSEEMKQHMEMNNKQMEKKLEEEFQKFTLKIEVQIEQIKRDMQGLRGEFEQSKEDMKQQVNGEIGKHKEELKNIVKETCVEEIKILRDKVKQLETRKAENIQVSINPNLFKTDMDIKFYGDERTHPIVFLKTLNARVEETGNREGFKTTVRSAMRGPAEAWFDIVEEKCQTLERFNEEFLSYYWGDRVQAKVRENLYTGRYDDNKGLTREEYAMRKISKAKYLRIICHQDTRNWDIHLEEVEDFINRTPNTITLETPEFLMTGEVTKRPWERKHEAYEYILKKVRERIKKNAEKYRKRENKRIRKHTRFKEGDLVVVKQLRTSDWDKNICAKLMLPFKGPYVITKTIGQNTYELTDLDTYTYQGKFHVEMLYPYES